MAFHKILIANRGEIACRIIRTAHAMGYEAVAVFSDVDEAAPHVQMADQAVRLGPAEASESYLNIDRILDAAKRTGADAIHPGYGFLAENADFAEQVIDAGLTWIGPTPKAMRIMSNKAAAKQVVEASGVPLIPGYAGDDQSDQAFNTAANKIGFPVMIKAAAGGGGRGIRLVETADDLPAALTTARSEAKKAFDSDELLLEKAIINSRHIEFQIFGDQQGNIIHLGERDCSIQRRHQKVVEETPSPAISTELREKMGEAAVHAAKAVGYVNAGTVEFLLSEAGDEFYFIEMNTRLQVEHPVTELVTGFDLVKWQLQIAAGEALPLGQSEVKLKGHAIEVRLYAESPDNNFLPSTGTVWLWDAPSGKGIRVDDGLRSGQSITPFYDAMVAKIIASGATREVAQRQLKRALQKTVILGVDTNRRFLIETITHPTFTSGQATTTFIEQNWQPNQNTITPQMEALAATIYYQNDTQLIAEPQLSSLGKQVTTYCFDTDPRQRLVRVKPLEDCLQVSIEAKTFEIKIVSYKDHRLMYELNSIRDIAHFVFDPDHTLWLQAGLETGTFRDVLLSEVDTADGVSSGKITAPMPGAVLRLDVGEGDTVQRGQVLLILEAMKMEHPITAPFDGVISKILVTQGQQMQPKELMLVVVSAHSSQTK